MLLLYRDEAAIRILVIVTHCWRLTDIVGNERLSSQLTTGFHAAKEFACLFAASPQTVPPEAES
jgi:hypothetical protein